MLAFCMHRLSEAGPNWSVQVDLWTFDSALWNIVHFAISFAFKILLMM